MDPKRVMIAENDYNIAEVLKIIVEKKNAKVINIVYSGKDAVEQACKASLDVIFMDINMEHKASGIEACKLIKDTCPGVKVYLITTYERETFIKDLENVDYDGYIDKGNFEAGISKIFDQ